MGFRHVFLLPALLLAGNVQAGGVHGVSNGIEKLSLITNIPGDHSHFINMVYHQLGRTFRHETGTISHVVLGTHDIKHPLVDDFKHRSLLPWRKKHSTSMTCFNNDGALRTFSAEQERSWANILCKGFAIAVPPGLAVLGVVISEAACKTVTPGRTIPCKIFIAIATAEAGEFIGKGIKHACSDTHKAIVRQCHMAGDTTKGGIDAFLAGAQGYTSIVEAPINFPDLLCRKEGNTECEHVSCGEKCVPQHALAEQAVMEDTKGRNVE